MMKNKRVAEIVGSFYDGLIVCQAVVWNKSHCSRGERFKEPQIVPGCIAQHHHYQQLAFPQYNLQYFADLKYIVSDHLCDYKKTNPIGGPSYHHTVAELIPQQNHGTVLQHITGGGGPEFSGEEIFRRTEQTMEAPEKYFF